MWDNALILIVKSGSYKKEWYFYPPLGLTQ